MTEKNDKKKKPDEMSGGMREPDVAKVMPEPEIIKANPKKEKPEKIGIHGFMVKQGLEQTKQAAFRSFVEQTQDVSERSMRDWSVLFKRFATKSVTSVDYLQTVGISDKEAAYKFEAWCSARGFPLWREKESWADDFRRYRNETAIRG